MSDPSASIPNQILAPADEIAEFCRSIIIKYCEHWPVSESVLAEEFLPFFGLDSFLTFEGVAQFCRSRLRIPVAIANMPGELRGFNGSYGEKREIVIAANHDIPDAKLHTLLHELRELIEHGFQKLGKPIVQNGSDDLEDRAEAFASSVQMSATIKLIPKFMDVAAEIEKKWMRIGAYVLTFAGAIFYCFACASIPRIEDAFAAERLRKLGS